MKKLNLAMKMKLLTVISGSFLILMTAVNIHAKSVIQDPSKVKVVGSASFSRIAPPTF